MNCQIDRLLDGEKKCRLDGINELAIQGKTKEGKPTGKKTVFYLCGGHSTVFLQRFQKALADVPSKTSIVSGPEGLEARVDYA